MRSVAAADWFADTLVLQLSVWKSSTRARRAHFSSAGDIAPGMICEPPHSHPCEFTSRVVSGNLSQTLYRRTATPAEAGGGRYAGVELTNVKEIWPAHDQLREPCGLTAIDHGVIQAGETYFMPQHLVHDVCYPEDDDTPTITLALFPEHLVAPDVFMEPPMLAYHDAHPHLLEGDKPLTQEEWSRAMKQIASYLRGDSATLDIEMDHPVRLRDSFAVTRQS